MEAYGSRLLEFIFILKLAQALVAGDVVATCSVSLLQPGHNWQVRRLRHAGPPGELILDGIAPVPAFNGYDLPNFILVLLVVPALLKPKSLTGDG